MTRNRLAYWLAGLGIAATLLLIGGMMAGWPAFAGFTPTSPPTEVPTATPTPLTPTTTPVPPTQPAPPPAETAVPTPTPTIPLLPESGGGAPTLLGAIILALGAAAILAGWTMRRRKQKHRAISSGTNAYR